MPSQFRVDMLIIFELGHLVRKQKLVYVGAFFHGLREPAQLRNIETSQRHAQPLRGFHRPVSCIRNIFPKLYFRRLFLLAPS